jgi:hypothetical protein
VTISIEEKLAACIVTIIVVLFGGALFCIHLIDAGKAEEKAAVFASEQKAEAKAALLTAAWQSQVASATTARQGEIDAAKDESLKPVAVVQLQRYTLRPAVPGTAAPAGASASPAGGGVVCSSVLQESPDQLQRDFAEAKRADLLTADYRDLYNSWPKTNNLATAAKQ